MTPSEKAAKKFVREFARQLPGSFDSTEGVKCFLAGVKWERKRAEGLVEAIINFPFLDEDPACEPLLKALKSYSEGTEEGKRSEHEEGE